MTQFKPFLILQRMVVVKGKKRAYDQAFSKGVNIIRGKNSSGKSTISDFIFYALGGDIVKLKNEARQCDFVYAEVSLSGSLFTLKREIKEGGRKGMDIASGAYEDVMQKGGEAWIRYPYNADSKESFYQAIFKELGIPLSKSEDKNSLTMHQLLRMMYVDQMTSPDRLFKFDRFDSPNKRKAIGELMLGASDFDLFAKRVELQRIESALDSRVKEIKTVHEFLGSSVKSREDIDREISVARKAIDEIEALVKLLLSGASDERQDEASILNAIALDIRKRREDVSRLKEKLAVVGLEIDDSIQFVETLRARLASLSETKDTISALSDLAFQHCPACYSKMPKRDHGCSLCGTVKENPELLFDPTFKVRKEIEFQVAESTKLIDMKNRKLRELGVLISQVSTELEGLEQKYSSMVEPQRILSIEVRQSLGEIGSLNNQIRELNLRKERFSKLHSLYAERNSLQESFNSTLGDVTRLESKLKKGLQKKQKMLSEATMEILHSDIDHEEIFNEGKAIDFSFSEDRVAIDERAIFSASSMVYLKNSFRLALLKCSAEDRTYIYPRFLLMDNIEDKGMESARSHLFQREILRVSDKLKVDHQIIFTTSMIDPDLEGSEYCVGPYYSDTNKSLSI